MQRAARAPGVKQYIESHTAPFKGGSEESCSICMIEFSETDGKQVAELSCEHIFHEECLQQWVLKNDSCPICRRSIIEENPF